MLNPRIKAVRVESGYVLHLIFTNNEEGLFDMTPYLSIGVFKELRDPSLFQTVQAFMGSVRWDHDQDLCPDTLYLESKKII